MTSSFSERDLVAWLDDAGAPVRPDYLDDLLARLRHTDQRPAWLPERWFPMQFTARTATLVPPPSISRGVLVLALLLVALVASLVLYSGARGRFPAPTVGLAANGLLAFASGGDIVTLDPGTGELATVVGGPTRDRGPAYSADGLHLAFERAVGNGWVVMVLDRPAGEPRAITPTGDPLVLASFLAWSHDGRSVAFISPEGGGRRVWVAATDGSGVRRIDFGVQAMEFTWRPPDGRELLIRGWTRETGYGLWLVGVDGSGPRRITSNEGRGSFDYLMADFTPDGRRVITQRSSGQAVEDYRLQVLDLEGGDAPAAERMLTLDPRQLVAPRLSPDGKRVASAVVGDESGAMRIAVMPVDGAEPVTISGPAFRDLDWTHTWSPDGRSVLAWTSGGDDLWLIDPAGGPERRLDLPTALEPDWQRRAP